MAMMVVVDVTAMEVAAREAEVMAVVVMVMAAMAAVATAVAAVAMVAVAEPVEPVEMEGHTHSMESRSCSQKTGSCVLLPTGCSSQSTCAHPLMTPQPAETRWCELAGSCQAPADQTGCRLQSLAGSSTP